MLGSSKLFIVSFTLLMLCFYDTSVIAQTPPIEAIYQFGDSISDTGNAGFESPGVGCSRNPYGETFFDHPTGRCSDGLLIIDHFAEAFKLPFINPYLDKQRNFSYGANFAVVGATALNLSILASKYGIIAQTTPHSLTVQLDWFKSHLTTLCSYPSECKQKLGNALFIVGEIGGNDYNFGATGGKTIQDLHPVVPDVVQTISNVVKELISLGATRIVIPGNFPVGCMTMYLATFKSSDRAMYDEVGCLKNWNDFATLHNVQLQDAIKSLQQQNPGVKLVYADYFSTLKLLFQNAVSLGFDESGIHKACCGISDTEYNYDGGRMCGSMGVSACPSPNVRVSWDSIHLTQQAYHFMADQLLKQITMI